MTRQTYLQCVRCGHLHELPEERKSLARGVGAVILAAIPMAALVVSILTFLSPAETVDVGKARAFLGAYYANAPFQPEETWKDLTDSYKENNAPELTFQEYEKYFTQFTEATATDVANYEPGRGRWYAATVFRENVDGTSATTRFAFDLQCPWYTRLPGIPCSSSNLQIANNCIVNSATGRCSQDETTARDTQ